MTVFDWKIQLLERDIQPADMDGAVVIAHWRCDGAEESEGVTYSSSSYGTCGFSPDPTAPGYIPYADLTQDEVLGWCWADGVDKDATEAGLQANIDLQINPVTASGVPW